MKNIAAFDVDPQKGFTPICPDELPVIGGDEIVDDLNEMAKLAKYRLGSKDAHPDNPIWLASDERPMLTKLDYEDADLAWNKHCVVGTKGFELLDGLPKPKDYDYFVWKGQEPDLHPYGACYHDIQEKMETGVFDYLKARDVDTVLVAGLAFDFCVKTTAIQLAKNGFKVMIYKKATRSISKETEDLALAELSKHNVVVIEEYKELKEFINKESGEV